MFSPLKTSPAKEYCLKMQEDFDKYGVEAVVGFSQADSTNGDAYNGADSGSNANSTTGGEMPKTTGFTSVYAKKPERPSGQMFGVLVCIDGNGNEVVLKAFSGQFRSVWNIPGWAPPLLSESEFARLTEKSDREIHELTAQIEALESEIKTRDTVSTLGAPNETRADSEAGAPPVSNGSRAICDGLSEKLRLLKETRRAASKRSMEEIFALYRVPVLDSLETAETYMWTNPKNGKSYPRYKLRPVIKYKSIFEFYGCGTQISVQPQISILAQNSAHDDKGCSNNAENRENNPQSTCDTRKNCPPDKMPPTGAGECCAPKLIAQAHSLGLRPVSLAEFYYGEEPASGEKLHKHFYEPCDEKCAPLLPAMLGLKVLYQDEAIVVVEKPSGLLSVPGRGAEKQDCVVNRVKFLFGGDIGWNDTDRRDLPENTEESQPHYKLGADGTDNETDRNTTIQCIEQPAVHRLDMETSGILVLALTEDAHRNLSRQFEEGSVKKQYEAVLDGIPECIKQGERNGRLELHFRLDVENRPRQIYDEVYGKLGITDWEFLRFEKGGRVRILFTPHTGRTHQLRLHSADAHGLGVPIVGDTLYGKSTEKAGTKITSGTSANSDSSTERLLLHARMLEFTHPVTGERMSFTNPAPF